MAVYNSHMENQQKLGENQFLTILLLQVFKPVQLHTRSCDKVVNTIPGVRA